jgi:hypothetical protein
MLELKAQWNAEALGYQEFAEDSELIVALKYVRCFHVRLDTNGFPIED